VVDWTYSFYIAVYFAVEAGVPDKPCAVYAVHLPRLSEAAKRRLPDDLKPKVNEFGIKDAAIVRELLNADSVIFPLNPYRLNQRLRFQQGVFLVPTNVSVPFAEGLANTLEGIDGENFTRKITFTFNVEQMGVALIEPRRMNITAEVLFPGMEGFARSLHQKIPYRSFKSGASKR
jgi:hypothetical protein